MATPGVFWSLVWLTGFIPCGQYMGKPLQSVDQAGHCRFWIPSSGEWVDLSICPGVNSSGALEPYNKGEPIEIRGYQIAATATDPDAILYMLVGSWIPEVQGIPQQGDVFASCAGHGAAHCARTLPIPLQQGGISDNPAHIDVYGYCLSGKPDTKVQFLAVLEYTVAMPP